MQRLSEVIPGLVLGKDRQKLKEHRQMIRQFIGRDFQVVLFIQFAQVDHRRATIPAFTMNMLEQPERAPGIDRRLPGHVGSSLGLSPEAPGASL
jgi:hypothetical protein